MPRVRFQPLRINKRSWQRPWISSTPAQHRRDGSDIEKPILADDDEYETDGYSSTVSSRASSGSFGSHDAMLKGRPVAKTTASAFATGRRARRTCNRYFTIIIGSILVVFVFALTQMHFHSVRDVALGLHKQTPKPPLWEDFPVLHRYYGGIRALVAGSDNVPEYPRSQEETSEEVVEALQNVTTDKSTRGATEENGSLPRYRTWSAGHTLEPPNAVECFIDPAARLSVPKLHVHDGVVQGFADHIIGMDAANSTESRFCLDRFGKLGPYGLGYSRKMGGSGGGLEGDREGLDQLWSEQAQLDFTNISWERAQSACTEANSHRFRSQLTSSGVHRTAILIRTSVDHHYGAEDLLNLRTIISEAVLATGASYAVHFLIEVPEDSSGVWSDDNVYEQTLDDALPAEFHGLGSLWSVDQMHLVYGDLARAFRSDVAGHSDDLLPVQHFAHAHPEYEYFWNWDLSVRSTGHLGSILESAQEWAQDQPRKEIWNRNDRYYVPVEHGSWEDFKQMVRVQSEHGTSGKSSIWSKAANRPGDADAASIAASRKPIWGAHPPVDDQVEVPEANKPPSSQAADDYQWGAGEEADLITFSPIFDPDGTLWSPADNLMGYDLSSGYPPRRASLSGLVRLSRRLLETMHREAALKRRYMEASMWPSSVALHYGYKAVYVPQRTYVDRVWPVDYLAAVFNNGLNGASGGARTSVFGDPRAHNLRGLSWSPNGQFAQKLWKRWLGYRVDGEGGEEWETTEGAEGRMCLPPMLLWPVRDVELVLQ